MNPTIYKKIYEIIRLIPSGKVATYGQISEIVGGCTARMVGYAVSSIPLSSVIPWQLATKGSQDWITWDLNDVRLRPTGRSDRRLLANLIYSGGRVLDVFVDGEAIRRDGVTLTIDELASLEALEDSAREYYSHI